VTLPKAWMSWSTGKDSAWAFHTIRKRHEVEVVALLTTVNAPAARVAMHAVRLSLVDAQAAALACRWWRFQSHHPAPILPTSGRRRKR
jgi:diphthamide synthase (EF-2-diphthine--ammonia ligase)